MTAFEILLNKFYETIEQNEPNPNQTTNTYQSIELFSLIRKYVETSFFYGNNLRYRDLLMDITERSAKVFKKSKYDDWLRIKYAFIDNDLHTIKRARCKGELILLKKNLDQIF